MSSRPSTAAAPKRTDSTSPVRTGSARVSSRPSTAGPQKFKRADLAAHAKAHPWVADATSRDEPVYMVIHNKVYDIKDLVPEHPGGAVILTHIGRDGSDAFDAFHPETTAGVLADFYIGDLVQEDLVLKDDEFAERIRKLKEEFEAKGLYKSQKWFFALQFAVILALISTAIYLIAAYPSSNVALVVSAAVMGLCWQQCGWLSHDFLHHAVFANRDHNNLVGYVVGGIFQGFSVHWWKDKHNTHHAQPNVHGEDPDIDTMPLLAWSEHALELFSDVSDSDVAQNPSIAHLMVPRQALLYFPILAVARVSWAIQSALYVTPLWKKVVDTPIPALEQLSVALHWVWYFGVMAVCLSPLRAVAYFALSQAFCGLFLATVFSLNHNGMAILSQDEADRTDFYTKQILTGRDVHPSMIMNWFCGGLNFQIEHHLFPMMPRHSYSAIKPVIEELCREYQVSHHSTGFWEGTGEVLARLKVIGDLAADKMEEAKKSKVKSE
ncbi:delta-6 fatty acid desaturase [Blastocladiella britannica]|nr:delta-6 fatty acid desaturase [Blastocladiella britannica]